MRVIGGEAGDRGGTGEILVATRGIGKARTGEEAVELGEGGGAGGGEGKGQGCHGGEARRAWPISKAARRAAAFPLGRQGAVAPCLRPGASPRTPGICGDGK